MAMFDDLIPAQQQAPAAEGLFDDLIPAAPSPAAPPAAAAPVDTKKYPYSADNWPYDDNSFVSKRKTVNGVEYRLHKTTGAIYAPDGTATDDPEVMAAFGKTKLSKRGQARADVRKPMVDSSATSILDNAISSIPGIGQQYSAAKWAIQTGQEIADTPQETTDAMAAAAQRPDQSSIATDWQAGSANVKTAYLGQQIIGLRDEITNLTRTAKERPDDQLIRQRLARAEDAYQRAYQMYDEASGQQFPQNPTFAALHDKDVPGTPAQKTAAAFRADPWGVGRTLTLQSGPVSIPSVAGGIIGSIAAGRPGAAFGAGVPSAYIEAGLNLRDQIAARGADMNDPASRRATFEKYADEIIRDAQISGLIVGAGDAAGAMFGSGVAALEGKGASNLVGKELVGTIADALFGAAGEGGKQVYNTGGISDPQSLIDEGLGEVVAGGVQQGGMLAVEGLKSAGVKTDRQKTRTENTNGVSVQPGQRTEPRLFDDLVPQAQTPAGNNGEKPATSPEGSPPAQDTATEEADILRQTGYSFEQIADMNPAERAQAAQEARQQGIEPIGTIAPEAPVPGTSAPAPGFGTRKQKAPIQTEQDMAAVRPVVNAQPSEAQASAGNYQKGHINLHGLDISIENPKGSVRRGRDEDGKDWASPNLPADYGYIKGTRGKDGDHVDVYIGPNPQSGRVFVIDQINLKDGKFDEHKAVLGADNLQQAVDLYAGSFDNPTYDRIGDVTEMSVDEFKAWSKNRRATKRPVGNVQPTSLTVPPRPQFAPVDNSQNDAADKAFDTFIASRKPITQEAFAAASGLDIKDAGRAIQRAALAGRVIQGRNGAWRRPPTRSTPIDAMDYIASIGGIRDVTGELAGMDLPKIGPFGPPVRKNGLHPDQVLERLIEAGYLRDPGRDTGGQRQLTVNDVYDLLARHMGGQKAYSIEDQAKADAIAATKKNEQIDPEWRPVHPIAQVHGLATWDKVQGFFADSGTSEETWSPQEVADAARFIAQGMDAGDAFERAAFIQLEDRTAPQDTENEFPEVIEWMQQRERDAMLAFGDMPPFPDVEAPRATQEQPLETRPSASPVIEEGQRPEDQADVGGDAGQVSGPRESGSEAGSAVSEEVGADNLPQTVIPGAEAVSEADAAKAAKAEKARKELEARRKQSKLRKSGQTSVEEQDGGLFGGKGPKQSSLLDAAPATPEPKSPKPPSRPNRVVIETGVVLRTKSGRETSPAPKIEATNDRKTLNTLKRMQAWLLDEARKEVANDEWQTLLLKGMDINNLSQADQDQINLVLFGDPDGATAQNVVRVDTGKKNKPATTSDATSQTEQAEAKPNSASDKPNSVSVDDANKPATTSDKQAEFRAFIDRRKKEADEFQAEFERVITEQKGFKAQQQITDVRGKSLTKFIMVTPSAQPGVKWQLTFGDNEGPSGHLDINSMEELAREVRGFIRNGYEAKGRFKLNIAIKTTEAVAEEATASLKPTPAKIEDFGEKIIGARKDAVRDIVKSLTDEVDVATEPLSKTFPQPDYVKMAEAGVDREALAYVALFRAEIPARPKMTWKVKQWSEKVKVLRDFSHKLLAGQTTPAAIRKKIYDDMPILAKVARTAEIIKDIEPKYLAFASQYSIASSQVSVLRGQTFKPAKQMFLLESDKQRWTNVDAETLDALREPALAFIRKKAEAELGTDGEGKARRTPLMLYKDRFTKEIFIGFKGRVEVIRLKTGFKDVKEARLYMADKADELQAQIDAMRQEPDLRRAANAPRSGPPRRPGDATPELFHEAFGFRGVQFGNYVEGDRRQSDLNEAFDALMDLSDTLGIPSQALSLGGKLGLAFGARGHGGKRAAAAHYEPGQVVINLTKHAGPGSLAHEWLHAFDHYFARLNNDGKGGGYISEAKTRGAAREPVWQAWKAIEKSIAKGTFAKRSDELDAARSKAYYGTTIEKAARAFERYIVDRLAEKQTNNDYLANIDTSGGAYPTAEEMQEQGIRKAFDDLFAALEVTKNERGQAVLSSRGNRPVAPSPRANAIPRTASITTVHSSTDALKAHPDYTAAKAGDEAATARLIPAIVTDQYLRDAAEAFGRDAVFVPVHAQEATGRNKIPAGFATFLQNRLGGTIDANIVQSVKAYHTGASPLERMIARPLFNGPVQRGARYVIVDDVTVLGGTIAEMADYIQSQGGTVVGVATLANQSRNGVRGLTAALPAQIKDIERRFGDEIRTEFGIDPSALTYDEAFFLRNFRDADALRDRLAAARLERQRRLLSKGIQQEKLNSSASPRPTFYSGLLRAVESIKQEKAPAAQWLGTIRNTPGVKPEEVAWLGLDDWLSAQTGTVTHAQIADFVRANQVQVSEVQKGGADKGDVTIVTRRLVREQFGANVRYDDLSVYEQNQIDAAAERELGITAQSGPTKFSQYQLPGGENYRELLLTLPTKTMDRASSKMRETAARMYGEKFVDRLTEAQWAIVEREATTGLANEYRSGHWDEPNVLAHVRFNERTDADGKKVLFIEEIQSDWHQTGRKKGYGTPQYNPANLTIDSLRPVAKGPAGIWYVEDGRGDQGLSEPFFNSEQQAIEAINKWYAASSRGVPDAPFKTSWPELAMKRMIRWAADNGFDRVAWTSGDVQAERYDLSKSVEQINWTTRPGVGKFITIAAVQGGFGSLQTNVNGKIIIAKGSMPKTLEDKMLDEVIGKEIAERIMAEEGGTIEDEGLRVGGNGMRGFYDKMLVDTANKLGKKFGAKVGTAKIPTTAKEYKIERNTGGTFNVLYGASRIATFPTESEAQDYANMAQPAHSIEITPAMRDAVLRGQPLFRRRSIPDRTRVAVLRVEIRDLASRILGHQIADVQIVEDMEAGGFSRDENAVYDPNTNVITIALDAAQDPRTSLRHEAIHALRQAGVFTPQEWAALSRLARTRWIDQHDIRNRYEQLYRERFDIPPEQIEELLVEEAIAEAFADYRANPRGEDLVSRIFDRVMRFLEAVANMARGHGYRTSADVFEAIDRGDVAGRQRGQGQSRDFLLYGREELPLSSRGRTLPPPRNAAAGSFEAPHDERVLEALTDSTATILERIRRAGASIGNEYRRKAQDREVDLLRTQGAITKAGGRIAEPQDAYLAASLYPGRVAQRDRDLVDDVIEPLIEEIARRGLTLDEVDQFNRARHAFERNLAIGQLYKPGEQFHDAMYNSAIVGGSGLSDDQAGDILNGFQSSGKYADLEAVGDKIVALNRQTIDKLLAEGLLTQEQHDAMTAKYQYYVPLRGHDEATDETHPDAPRTGSRYDVRGQEVSRAFGRTSQSDSPLAYSIMQARQAIGRIEKNRVGKRFLRLAQANPNEAFWQVNRRDRKKIIDRNTGLVRYVNDPGVTDAENVLAVKVGGQAYHITMHHTGLAAAMKGMGTENMHSLVVNFHKINRYLASMYTSYSPEFIFTNLLRDLQQTGIVLQEEKVKGITRSVLAAMPKAAAGMNAMLRGDLSSPWARYAREYADAGGKMGFMGRNDIETEKRSLERLMREQDPSKSLKAWMVLRDEVVGRLDRYNDSIENTLRLATYVALRNAGVSRDKAAFSARELTVNFNRKGEWSSGINAFYLFFNAASQGAASLAMRFARSKTIRRVCYGIMLSAFAQDMLNRMIAGDDDDGENRYDKIPDEIKARNGIVMFPKWLEDKTGVPYLKWPLPLGYNMFHVIGTQVGHAAAGARTPLEAAAEAVSSVANAFNPLGGGGTILNFFSPTLLDPAADIATNTNFFGENIIPRVFDETTPYAERYKDNVNPAAKWITETLSQATGGSPERKGGIDWSPEWVEHVWDFAAGGVGRMINNASTTTRDLFMGADVDATKVPFARTFVGQTSKFADRDAYYEIKDAVHVTQKEIEARQKEGDTAAVQRIQSRYARELRMIKAVDEAEKNLAKLRRDMRAVKALQTMGAAAKRTRIDEISRRMDAIQLDVRRAWNAPEPTAKTSAP